MSEYAGRDRYKLMPPAVPTAAAITTQQVAPAVPPEVPLGPDAADGDGD